MSAREESSASEAPELARGTWQMISAREEPSASEAPQLARGVWQMISAREEPSADEAPQRGTWQMISAREESSASAAPQLARGAWQTNPRALNPHLPPGVTTVDLADGGSLPGSWVAHWRAEPDAPVLSTLDSEWVSAAELDEHTEWLAGKYAAAGLTRGDRVLLSGPTGLELVLAYVAALRAGLTVVPANPALSAAELAALVEAARPKLAVVEDPAWLSGLPVPAEGLDLGGLSTGDAPALDAAAPEDIALIIYTSGTTGRPKGVPLSHRNLLASAHAVRLAWRWEPDDDLALALPLFHVHGLGVGLHGTLTAGASATLIPKFAPDAVARAISQGSTMFFGVPTMYHRLADSHELAALSRLRLAVSGSAPLAADLFEAVQAGSGQTVLERYGMTETIMLVSNPCDGERRPGTVGLPLPGVELRLDPREGNTAEIQVRGPNVIRGYLDNPEADEAAYTSDGWFRTGDLGDLDEAGYLRISGRAKELIITGGYNVYPREVEEVLRAHPAVADAAVVGRPSVQWGETVVAFVVGDAPADELEQWCADRLVAYKRPREWRRIDAIPRNALGKVLRHHLS
jgi:malonyl-CoA/methylmalonyl-CoA synthetase